jgi:WD40 repeat protein
LTVILWVPTTGQLLHTLRAHAISVLSVAFDPSGTWVLSGGADQTVRVWEAATGRLLHTATLPGSKNPTFHFRANGTATIATHNFTCDMRLWRVPLPPARPPSQ